MRIRYVILLLGSLLLLLSGSMLPAAAWSIHDHFADETQPGAGEAAIALILSGAVGVIVGLTLILIGRSGDKQLGRREALLLVALSWVVGAALSGLPFRLWASFHPFPAGADQGFASYLNCYFEAMSGLTTTGATILGDVESIPRSLLLWRACTHWLGGLGIVVLFVAVLPMLGVGGKRLFRFEAPGPKKEGLRPRIRAAAQVLWLIYTGITLAEVLALKVAGMNWCDAFSHALATMATGGFSTYNASVAGAAPNIAAWVEIIIVVFMFLAGVNFGLYDQLTRGRLRDVWTNPELRVYLITIFVATVLITAMLLFVGHSVPTIADVNHDVVPTTTTDANPDHRPGFWTTLRHSAFTVVAIQTTTGFCTADFDQWPGPAKGILVMLMFVGGCAGSTGGGIKVIRFVVLAKVLWAELETVFRPNVVRTVRVGRSTVDPQLRTATLVYFLLVGLILVVATGAVIQLEGPNIAERKGDVVVTSFATVAATLNNIGPGLDLVGASCNYAWFNPSTKLLLCLLMALGRLELYAFLVLVVPRFWREE